MMTVAEALSILRNEMGGHPDVIEIAKVLEDQARQAAPGDVRVWTTLMSLGSIAREIMEKPDRLEVFEMRVDAIREAPRFKRIEVVIRIDGDHD